MPNFPEQIEVEDDSIDEQTGLSEEVSLLIDDIPYKFWNQVDIDLSLDDIADRFTLSGPFDYENPSIVDVFRPYKYREVGIYVGGQKVMTGTMIKPKTNNTGNSSTITVEGYSSPGIMADVNVSPDNWPLSINGLNLEEIANKLLSPFEIDVVFEADPGAKFTKADKARLEPDEQIGNFLIKLAKQRGLIISSNEKGELIFKTIGDAIATMSLKGGEWPVINSSTTFDGQTMFTEITALGTNNKKGFGQKATVENPALANAPKNRPMVFKASDIAAGGLQAAATAKLGRMIAESVQIDLDLVGWFQPQPESTIWKPNQRIFFESARDMLYEDEYIIRNVKLSKGPDAATTSISLVFPESYNGEIKSSFPWE